MTGCGHDRGRPCPIPGCPAGPEGELVVCGVTGARRFERGFVVVAGEVRIGWVEAREREEAAWRAA